MTIKHTAALGIVLALAVQAPAWAQSKPQTAAKPMNASPGAVFASWDTDKDKKLTEAEFNAGWAQMERAALVRQLKAQFDRQDADKSGSIDSSEYAKLELVRRAGAGAPPIARFDGDKSGALDFKEYVALLTAMMAKTAPAPAQAAKSTTPSK